MHSIYFEMIVQAISKVANVLIKFLLLKHLNCVSDTKGFSLGDILQIAIFSVFAAILLMIC